MDRLSWTRFVCLMLGLCLAMAIGAGAQTFTTLANFNLTNGEEPEGPLVQGPDGSFYGTTFSGGQCCGTVFKVTSAGAIKALHSFCSKPNCADGNEPGSNLALGTDGNFYGVTFYGGSGKACTQQGGCGTVFRITSTGKLTTLYNFCSQPGCTDGAIAIGGLVQASDGNFYGTTFSGGSAQNYGTVFKITPKGILTTLYSFCPQPNCTDGQYPWAGLVQGNDGNFYGTTEGGGTVGPGTVFRITPSGTLTTLYSFCTAPSCADGAFPYAPLAQGSDGNFYGTTSENIPGPGTLFQITPGGTLTTLYTFCSQPNCTDGDTPYAGLVQATDGNLYGTTSNNGPGSGLGGTVFNITSGGTLTTLYGFCGKPTCTDGGGPTSSPVQGTDGSFYGLTHGGGIGDNCKGGCGTVYNLSMGLGAFIRTVPTSGKTAAKVMILGNNLTGATSVSFNGTKAKFTVVSGTEIKTKVPKGAATGPVTVTTTSGPLTSNVPFVVQ